VVYYFEKMLRVLLNVLICNENKNMENNDKKKINYANMDRKNELKHIEKEKTENEIHEKRKYSCIWDNGIRSMLLLICEKWLGWWLWSTWDMSVNSIQKLCNSIIFAIKIKFKSAFMKRYPAMFEGRSATNVIHAL
jgi:hypothetical protein